MSAWQSRGPRWPHWIRQGLLLPILLAASLLAGCGATMKPADYAAEKPTLDLKTYFNGTVDAWGKFQDRSGKVVLAMLWALAVGVAAAIAPASAVVGLR